jgi:hypothetical protein
MASTTLREKQMFSKLILRLLWKMKANGWENSRAASMLWQMWDHEPITVFVDPNEGEVVAVSPNIPFIVEYVSDS